MYQTTSSGIKRSKRASNRTPVSSAQVTMHNTKFPLVLVLYLNEKHYLKFVRVSTTEMYVKETVGCSAD